MNKFNLIAAALALAVSSIGAQAATVVASGGTQPGGPAYVGGATTVAVSDPADAWAQSPLGDDYDDAVWISHASDDQFTNFSFSFDLDGYDVSSASLSVRLAFDDLITVTLNGIPVFEDNVQYDGDGANWGVLQGFTASEFFKPGVFKSGVNVLAFAVKNTGGPGGLRASTIVTASPSAVPVPAALPLLAGGLMALGAVARRRKRA